MIIVYIWQLTKKDIPLQTIFDKTR